VDIILAVGSAFREAVQAAALALIFSAARFLMGSLREARI